MAPMTRIQLLMEDVPESCCDRYPIKRVFHTTAYTGDGRPVSIQTDKPLKTIRWDPYLHTRITEWPEITPLGKWKYQTNDPNAYVIGSFEQYLNVPIFIDENGMEFGPHYFAENEYFERID